MINLHISIIELCPKRANETKRETMRERKAKRMGRGGYGKGRKKRRRKDKKHGGGS